MGRCYFRALLFSLDKIDATQREKHRPLPWVSIISFADRPVAVNKANINRYQCSANESVHSYLLVKSFSEEKVEAKFRLPTCFMLYRNPTCQLVVLYLCNLVGHYQQSQHQTELILLSSTNC